MALAYFSHLSERLSKSFLIFLLIGLVFSILIWVLYLSRYGFDITDEGYYLVSIARPDVYAVNVPPTMFGFVVNPIYDILGGDLVALRQLGVLSTFALAWCLSFLALRNAWAAERADFLNIAAIAAATACVSLVYYSHLVATPSYNLVVFQSLMLIALGVLLAPRGIGVVGGGLIGVGGWLLFLAKPSSAALMAFIVPLQMFVSGNVRLKSLVLSALIAFGLLFVSSIYIDGSPSAFAIRISKSLELTQVTEAGHGFAKAFRLDNPNFSKSDVIPLLSWMLFAALTFYAGLSKNEIVKSVLIAACVTITLGIVAYFYFGWGVYTAGDSRYLFLIAMVIGAVSLIFAVITRTVSWQNLRGQIATSGFLITLPHVYIFGSNNNYWQSGASAGYFWILSALCFSGLLFTAPARRQIFSLVPLAFLFPLVTIVLLDRAVQIPYRQPPDVRSYTVPYTLVDGGTLILSEGFSRYFLAAAEQAQSAGLSPGSSVIDLTGQSVGLIHVLGLHNVGLPWIPGGYPGSNALMTEVLRSQSCDILATAWLLDEPEGVRRISPSVLLSFGADFVSDYNLAGSFTVADHAGGRSVDTQVTQHLYRPSRFPAAAEQSCEEKLRTGHQNFGSSTE